MRAIAPVLLLFACVVARASDGPASDASELHRLKLETAREMQEKVLDPVLGAGLSRVFADFSVEVTRDREFSERSGVGRSQKSARKQDRGGFGLDGSFEVAASTRAKGGAKEPVDLAQEQKAEQSRGAGAEKTTLTLRLKDLKVLVLYEAGAPAERLEGARQALLAAYSADLKDSALTFKPAPLRR